jgi:hypothetical protein
MKLYKKIANLLLAYQNCVKNKNEEWKYKHKENIENLCSLYMPHGGGFDDDTSLNILKSTPNRLRFETSYHPLNENGFYENWIDFTVIIKPSLAFDFDIVFYGLTKKQKENYLEYFVQMFCSSLDEEVE